MAPLKVGAPSQFVRVTRKLGRKEIMEEPKSFVELEDVIHQRLNLSVPLGWRKKYKPQNRCMKKEHKC
jgi:hypothetical protein